MKSVPLSDIPVSALLKIMVWKVVNHHVYILEAIWHQFQKYTELVKAGASLVPSLSLSEEHILHLIAIVQGNMELCGSANCCAKGIQTSCCFESTL